MGNFVSDSKRWWMHPKGIVFFQLDANLGGAAATFDITAPVGDGSRRGG
jgi:hypothetical protein